MSARRTIHFSPPEAPPEPFDGRQHTPEPALPRNPIDALGAIARDVSTLREMTERLVSDAEGRHGRLHVMRQALRRLQENIKILIDLEEA